jgi:hypothetical protein
VQLKVEYSNSEQRDWKAPLDVVRVDGDGTPIDGCQGDEGLDGEASHGKVTVTLPTLEYGLARARKLKLVIGSEAGRAALSGAPPRPRLQSRRFGLGEGR